MYTSVFKGEDLICPHFIPNNKNIAPLIGAAMVYGASSLAGGILAQSAQSEQGSRAIEAQRLANEANIQMVRESNQANYDLYKEQLRDHYEQPANEVLALRNAGLNPALAYSGNASMPSAAEMKAAQVQPAPYEAYNDSFMNGVLASLPAISESLQGIQEFATKSIDNQTRDAYNRKALENIDVDIQSKMAEIFSKGVNNDKTRAEIFKLKSDKEAVDFLNRLNSQTYENNLKLSDLSVKAQELQNRVLDDQNSRDAARLAIEKFNATNSAKLTAAQIGEIKVLSNLAINQDWRDSQSHVVDMNLKQLDSVLRSINVSSAKKNAIFQDIMNNSEIMHNQLKDASLVNKLVERAFGLGFRDIGAALRNLLAPK